MTPSEVPFTKLYRNGAGSNTYAVNEAPQAPVNLQSEVDSNTVLLNWNRSTDDITPMDGLNYNLRIGTSPGTSDILAPMSDVVSGLRYLQAIGNTNADTSWTITNLAEGTYYWSVQAIDQAYVGSDFAEEQTFTILITDVNEVEEMETYTIYPNPARDIIHVNVEAEYRIYNINGQEMLNGTSAGNKIDISSLLDGIYFIQFDAQGTSAVQRLIVQ
jgi:hypothetical protein